MSVEAGLVLEQGKCAGHRSCLKSCPKNVEDKRIFNCVHCSPEIAECKATCRKGAVKEQGGFLCIDESVCDGCFECKCSKDALVFRNAKIVKCDYCFGKPACVRACPENALRASSACRQSGNFLGWRAGKAADYFLPVPELSFDEEQAVFEIVERFKEVSKNAELGRREEAQGLIEALIKDYCRENGLFADSDQMRYLCDVAVASICGYGILEHALKDDELEEIAVCGLNTRVKVYHRKKGWLETNAEFTREETLLNLINKMARPLGRRLTLQTPRLNAVLPDGSRLHASIPPISGYELTIRKFRAKPISIPDLISFNTFSSESLAFLWLSMQSDASMIISGNTASGKTSTLNALFSFVPLKERVIITEETPEINIPHEHKVRLVSNEELGVKLMDLVADCIRMRPDRIIVGEVRTSEEASALVETVLSGQAKGSYATFHASTAGETLQRLRSLGILAIDLESIDLIIVQRRISKYDVKTRQTKEVRRATEISEVVSSNALDSIPKTNALFAYNPKTDKLERTRNKSFLLEKIASEFCLSEREVERELLGRKAFLEKLASSNTGFFESIKKIQKKTFA